MYESFTDRSRKVMAFANQESLKLNHEYIGTEHVLLGLIKEQTGVANHVLTNLGVSLDKVRQKVNDLVQMGPGSIRLGELPLTPRAKKVVEYAYEEARLLKHSYIGTEHLLLGLVREKEGVAAQVLMDFGLTLETIREEALNLLGHHKEEKTIPLKEAMEILGVKTMSKEKDLIFKRQSNLENLEKQLVALKRRYFRPVIKYPYGHLVHHGDCEIFRSEEVYGYRFCSCGMIHDLKPMGSIAIKLYPKVYEDETASYSCHHLKDSLSKEEVEALVVKIYGKPHELSEEETREDKLRDNEEWELIELIFGIEFVKRMKNEITSHS